MQRGSRSTKAWRALCSPGMPSRQEEPAQPSWAGAGAPLPIPLSRSPAPVPVRVPAEGSRERPRAAPPLPGAAAERLPPARVSTKCCLAGFYSCGGGTQMTQRLARIRPGRKTRSRGACGTSMPLPSAPLELDLLLGCSCWRGDIAACTCQAVPRPCVLIGGRCTPCASAI